MLIAFVLLIVQEVNSLDLDVFYKYFVANQNSSHECQLQKDAFLKSLDNKSSWAISMLDAYGRIPQAITQGNVYDLGTYDQCLNIHEDFENITIEGKYCLGGLTIPNPLDLESTATRLLISACVPNNCLPSDFFGDNGNDDDCQTKSDNETLDGGDIAFLAFSVLIILMVISSTIYDLHIQKHSKVPYHKILIAFSAYTNGKKIIKVNNQPGQILFFNGLKVISLFWVVLGHRFESNELRAVNKVDAQEWQTKLYAMYLLLFALAVDTFFFISAVLLAYTFLRSHKKSNKKFNIFLYYIHRYFRLTPAMAALYFFQTTIARRIASGPYSPPQDITGRLGTPCKENWWSYFLYIQNYISPNDMCLVHTWYVDVDMQFILVSPLILLPLLHFPKQMKYVGLPLLIVITTIPPMLITHFYELSLANPEEFMAKYYLLAHTRLSGWLVGIMFGAFMLDFKENEAKYRINSTVLHVTGWAVVFAVFAAQFPIERDFRKEPTVLKTMLYYPLQRTIWPLCLCWISYACLCGKGGVVDWFLSLPIFQVLGKILYSTYLIHLCLISMHIIHSRTLCYFSHYEVVRDAIADIVVALVAGACWALAFEYPGMNIEQALFGAKRSSKKQEGQNEATTTHLNPKA